MNIRIRCNNKTRYFGKSLAITVFAFLFSLFAVAQESGFRTITMHGAVNMALENHPAIKQAALETEETAGMKMGVIDIPPTSFNFVTGQLYSPANDRYFEINQNFGSLLKHINRIKAYNKNLEQKRTMQEITEKEIIARVKSAYIFWIFQHGRIDILKQQKDIYGDFVRIAKLRYDLGESSLLESTMAVTKAEEIENNYKQALDELMIAQNKLRQLIICEQELVPAESEPDMYKIDKPSDTSSYSGNLVLSWYRQKYEHEALNLQAERSAYFPGLSAGYFNQQIGSMKGLHGWQFGFHIPLFFLPQQARIKHAKINSEKALSELEYKEYNIRVSIENLHFELNKHFKQLVYYNEHALAQAELIMHTAQTQYENENIEYHEYIQSMASAFKIKLSYLETLNHYNQTAVQLEFYIY